MTATAADKTKTGIRPWERSAGFWERFRIRWAGWRDRPRTRRITDDQLTHYLIHLQERAQGFQVEVLQWVSTEDLRLEAAIAAHQDSLEQRAGEPAKAAATPGPQATPRQRAEWATSQRNKDRADAERDAHRKRQAQTKAAIGSLKKEREGLAEQRDLHFAACRQWFDQRAALYNRARTGWFGLPKTSQHKIPAFEPISFTDSKPQDIFGIGDHPEEVTH